MYLSEQSVTQQMVWKDLSKAWIWGSLISSLDIWISFYHSFYANHCISYENKDNNYAYIILFNILYCIAFSSCNTLNNRPFSHTKYHCMSHELYLQQPIRFSLVGKHVYMLMENMGQTQNIDSRLLVSYITPNH